jgi:hypothetical protein
MANSVLFIGENPISKIHDSSKYHLQHIETYTKINLIKPDITNRHAISDLDHAVLADPEIVAVVVPYFLTNNESALAAIQGAFNAKGKAFDDWLSGKTATKKREAYFSAKDNIEKVICETDSLAAPEFVAQIRKTTNKSFPIIIYSSVPDINPQSLDSHADSRGTGPQLYVVSKCHATNYLEGLLNIFLNGPSKFSKVGLSSHEQQGEDGLGEIISVDLMDTYYNILIDSLPKKLIPEYRKFVAALKFEKQKSTREWRAKFKLAQALARAYQNQGILYVAEDFYPRPPRYGG